METSPLSSLEETVVADGDEASQQQENFQNKGRKISIDSTNPGPGNILLCVKGKHGPRVSVDTLESEVVNMNEIAVVRRSQRRKT